MQANETFIIRLNELVEEMHKITGKSKNAMAKEMGINQPTLFRYLNGEREPGINNLAKIAEYFGVSSDWLLGLKSYEKG